MDGREGDGVDDDQPGPWIDIDDGDALRAAGLGHLADDAPEQVCSACGRHTVAESMFGQRCGFPQPDGSRCDGVFGPDGKLRTSESSEETLDEAERLAEFDPPVGDLPPLVVEQWGSKYEVGRDGVVRRDGVPVPVEEAAPMLLVHERYEARLSDRAEARLKRDILLANGWVEVTPNAPGLWRKRYKAAVDLGTPPLTLREAWEQHCAESVARNVPAEAKSPWATYTLDELRGFRVMVEAQVQMLAGSGGHGELDSAERLMGDLREEIEAREALLDDAPRSGDWRRSRG
jgi:hypothetical protein